MRTLVCFLTLAQLVLPTSSDAAPPQSDQPRSITVAYADLDLEHPVGVATLYGRLEHAAEVVCAAYRSAEPDRQASYRNCRSGALQTAVVRIGNQRLAELHAARTPGSGVGDERRLVTAR